MQPITERISPLVPLKMLSRVAFGATFLAVFWAKNSLLNCHPVIVMVVAAMAVTNTDREDTDLEGEGLPTAKKDTAQFV